MYGTLKKGPRYLEMAEGYVTGIALDADDQIIGYQFVNLGKMTDFIKKADDPNTAWEKGKRSVRPCSMMQLRSSTRVKNKIQEDKKKWHYLNHMRDVLIRSIRCSEQLWHRFYRRS